MYGSPGGAPPGHNQGPQGYGQPPAAPPPAAPPQGGKSGFATMMLAIGPAIFGICGMHRIYTGHIGIGIAQFLTFGGCGIWQLIDIISIATRKFTDKEGRPLTKDHPIRKLM